MLVKSKLTLIIFLLLSSITYSQTVYKTNSSSVEFTSDAPLELIEAKCTALEGVLKTDDRTFAFRTPMTKFEGFNSALQKTHFNANYLETAKYPFTIFEGKIIEDIDLNTPGTYNVRGKGRFTCHGVEQERIIKCKVIVGANSIKIKTEFTVLLDDHNIQIPSVVNQRIAEEIFVIIDINMKK